MAISPLAVQVLAGVLLPSATVFLLLLCYDKSVLGCTPTVRKSARKSFSLFRLNFSAFVCLSRAARRDLVRPFFFGFAIELTGV